MNYWKYWSSRQDSAAVDNSQPFSGVREFIYINGRSVRSLLASVGSGALPTEETERDASVRERQRNVGVGGSAGPASINLGQNTRRQQSEGREMVSSFNEVQSLFTQLKKEDRVEKVISTEMLSNSQADTSGSDDEPEGFRMSLEELERGNILELHVKIDVEDLYRWYRVMQYFHEVDSEELDAQTAETLELIEESFASKIPLICTPTELVLQDGEIREKALTNDMEREESVELEIVTLLDETLLKVDPIQNLFGKKEFYLFCRIEETDIDHWYPLKLVRALESVAPDLAEALNRQFEISLSALDEQVSDFSSLHDLDQNTTSHQSTLLRQFSDYLEARLEFDISEQRRNELIEETVQSKSRGSDIGEMEQRRNLLNAYTDRVLNEPGTPEIDSDQKVNLREDWTPMEGSSSASDGADSPTSRIEVSTIAIYW